VIVVDTHTLIWWINDPSELSDRAAAEINSSDQVAFSAISCWEVAMLVWRGRISLNREVVEWWNALSVVPHVTMLPLTPEIGATAAELGDVLRDPADCLIVATSLKHHSRLVTRDGRIRDAQIVATVW